MTLVSFSLFLDAFPPRPKMPFTCVVNVYRDITILGVFRTHAQKEYSKVWEMKSIPILNTLALLLF